MPIAAQQAATKPAAQPTPAAAASAGRSPRPLRRARGAAPDGTGRHHRVEEHRRDRVVERRDAGSPTACRRSRATARSSSGRPTATRSTRSRSARRRRRAAGPAGLAKAGPPPATLRVLGGLEVGRLHGVPDPRREPAAPPRSAGPIQAKVQLLDLTSGKDVTIENVRRFAFAGERGGWIALQKAPAPGGGAGGGAAPAPAPGGASGGGAGAASDRPKGADLILRDLATGRDLNIGNVAEFAFDKSGTLPRARHRRARQGRQRRPAPEHGVGRRVRARQRQGVVRAPRLDREGRRPLRA